jgi:hypothetical protein
MFEWSRHRRVQLNNSGKLRRSRATNVHRSRATVIARERRRCRVGKQIMSTGPRTRPNSQPIHLNPNARCIIRKRYTIRINCDYNDDDDDDDDNNNNINGVTQFAR